MSLLNACRKYLGDRSGNVATIVALSAVPLLGLVGGAIEFQMVVSQRSQMQDALDSATLAVMSRPLAGTAADRRAELERFYSSSGARGSVSVISDADPNSEDATYHTSASQDAQTAMLGIVGIESIPLRVESTVVRPQSLEQVSFVPVSAQGWWNKEISMFGRPVGRTNHVELVRISYAWDQNTSSVGGTVTVSQPINGSWREMQRLVCSGAGGSLVNCRQVSGSSSPASVDLRNYEDVYMRMVVSPARSNEQADFDLRQRYGYNPDMRTDDPAVSNFLFIDGVQQEHGRTMNISGDIPCGQWSDQHWEDGATYPRYGPYTGTL